MTTKKFVSKKDIMSVRSIIRKHFERLFDGKIDSFSVSLSSYNGIYEITSGEYHYMTIVFQNDIGDYYVRFIKRVGYNHIRDYKIVSIQFMEFGDETPLVEILHRYCGAVDPDIKDLFLTYIELCPDTYTFDKMFDIKYGNDYKAYLNHLYEAETKEAETEEAETEEAKAEMVSDEARAEIVSDEEEIIEPIDIEDVITTNKHTDYNAYRKEKLLSVDFDTLDKLYCLARSFINGRYYNFRYYITDMQLSCCEREDADLPFPTIRDYIACRIHVKSDKGLQVDEEICCYIVIKDERYAETLIYI